ncbi:MAG: FAD binding domain-containing protein [Thermodesulfobacteriota bacterium]
MRTFQYLKPTSVREAQELLSHFGEKAKIIAGGTDLMVQWKKKLISPEAMISVRNVPELNFVRVDQGLAIGSATTHRSLETNPEVRRLFPVITDAVDNLGSVQVRNSATIGGNICNAAPSADTAPPLLVLDAVVSIAGKEGTTSVPISEFFGGPSRTVLKPGQLVTDFAIPAPAPNTGMAYWKHSRRKAMDLPMLGVAVLLSLEDDLRTCRKARIALGVSAPVPMRAKQAEAFLEGKSIDESVLTEAGKIAVQEAKPRTTIRASEWYRRELIPVLVKRTGLICIKRAGGKK